MKERGNFLHKIAFDADLPGEALPRQPVVELIGECRLLVENHKGVAGYSNDRIVINMSYGQLSVCGSKLLLACMTRHQLVITGRIESFTLCSRRGK